MLLIETGLPFDDVRRLVHQMPPLDQEAADIAQGRNSLKPSGEPQTEPLGLLEKVAPWLAACSSVARPKIMNPLIALFATSHGIASHPQALATIAQKMQAFGAGESAINPLARHANASLQIFELGTEVPTGKITLEDAMSEKECVATFAYGMESLAQGTDLLCIGEVGEGSTIVGATLCAALLEERGNIWAELPEEVKLIQKALDFHGVALKDPLEALRRVGGRDIAAMVGAIVAARYQKVPVLLNGFVACVAAFVVLKMSSFKRESIEHCWVAGLEGDIHQDLLVELNKNPVLDLDIQAGEGCYSALAIPLLRAATVYHQGIKAQEPRLQQEVV